MKKRIMEVEKAPSVSYNRNTDALLKYRNHWQIETMFRAMKSSGCNIEDTYLTVTNVCSGTCIGDKGYYYQRKIVDGTPFALGSAIMFYDHYHTLKKK